MDPSALDAPALPLSLRWALFAALLLVVSSGLAFGARQSRPGRVGGPIAPSKLAWLILVVHLALVAPLIFLLAPSLGGSSRVALGLFAASFWIRAGVELWLMYRRGAWRPIYGIVHDVLAFGLAAGGAVLLEARAVTPIDQLAWGLLVLLAGVMVFETAFAALHLRAVGEKTQGRAAVWFAPPRDPAFRASRRLTALALALLLPGVALLHALALWAPARAAGATAAAELAHPAVIAHRGASWVAPEATLPAYLVARRIEPDYVEIDLQRTRDGVLIAFHDDAVRRTTNASQLFPGRASSPPSAFTWPELARLDAGSWFNLARPDRAHPAFEGLRVLRFEEVVRLLEAGGGPLPGLYIETKSPKRHPGIEEELVRALQQLGWLDEASARPRPGRRVIFQSFDGESLRRLRALAPEVPRVRLVEARVDHRTWTSAIEEAEQLGAWLGASGWEAWPSWTAEAHAAGRLVHHYTLNAPWEMAIAWRFGSDGFFTDRADVAMRMLGRETVDAEEALDAWAKSRAP